MRIRKSCRKIKECIPCVRNGCMYPGFTRFPCREDWDDIEGDYPNDPIPASVSDCYELEFRLKTTTYDAAIFESRTTSTIRALTTSSVPPFTTTVPATHGSNLWIMYLGVAILGFVGAIWMGFKKLQSYFNTRMEFGNVQYRHTPFIQDDDSLD